VRLRILLVVVVVLGRFSAGWYRRGWERNKRGVLAPTTRKTAEDEGRRRRRGRLRNELTLTSRYSGQELDRWLKQGWFVVFKNAQSMVFGCHLEETVILQRELKKKIARSNRKDQGNQKQ
jgi:hypothetical protein